MSGSSLILTTFTISSSANRTGVGSLRVEQVRCALTGVEDLRDQSRGQSGRTPTALTQASANMAPRECSDHERTLWA